MFCFFFFFQAEDGIRDYKVTGVQTCALPIYRVAGARFDVALRPARFADETRNAQLLSIVAGSQGLESLRDSAGRDVPVLRLEPLLIGSLFPIPGEDRINVTPQEKPTLLPPALESV